MSRFGLDSVSHLTAADHKSAGSSFGCRYLSTDAAKNLTAAEVKDLRGGGIDIVVVWETTANRSLQGHAAGVADAHAALAEANKLGLPAHRPIYFAVDFDEATSQSKVVDDYFHGASSVLGVDRTGVYGDFYVVERVIAASAAKYGWQTYAWSGGQVSKRAQLLQYSNGHTVRGKGVDYNRALAGDFGQWGFEPPAPKPVVLKDPTGEWHFQGSLNMGTGVWTIEGLPGANVQMGEHPRLWAAKLTVDEQHGDWHIDGLPFVEVK